MDSDNEPDLDLTSSESEVEKTDTSHLRFEWLQKPEPYYEAEYAPGDQSICSEFRCREKIAKGALRIGLRKKSKMGTKTIVGLYHPACLFKTFFYKKAANKEVSSVDQILRFDVIIEKDQKLIRHLIEKHTNTPSAKKRKREEQEQANQEKDPEELARLEEEKRRAGQVKIRKDSTLGCIIIGGKTFDIKDLIKACGGAKFDKNTKRWKIPKVREENVKRLFKVSEIFEDKDVVVSVGTLLGCMEEEQQRKKRKLEEEKEEGKDEPESWDAKINYSKCTVAQLKDLMKLRGEPIMGKRVDLFNSLVDAAKRRNPIVDEHGYKTRLLELKEFGYITGDIPE